MRLGRQERPPAPAARHTAPAPGGAPLSPPDPSPARPIAIRALTPGARRADRALAAVAASFDYLRLVTPVDVAQAWEAFRGTGCRSAPTFTYRTVDVDVGDLRRQLAEVDLDAVEDAALAGLLAAKRGELEHLLALVDERGTPAFLPTSIAVSGPVDDELCGLARQVLQRARSTRPDEGETVAAEVFAERAAQELAAYRRSDPALTGSVSIREDVASLMVSKDQLLVPSWRRVAVGRVEALVHHEVGTHLLTWWNGRHQPLQLLADGLAAYEETQEGLGVLAEHLAGGLPPARLGELAVRVLAARSVSDGAAFVETFGLLHDDLDVPADQAFAVSARVHRGGGLVKDAGYLRGLVRVVEHLRGGGDITPLLVGKLPLAAVGAIEQLLGSGVLAPPRLLPRWMEGAGAERLGVLRSRPGGVVELLLP